MAAAVAVASTFGAADTVAAATGGAAAGAVEVDGVVMAGVAVVAAGGPYKLVCEGIPEAFFPKGE